MRAPSRLQNGLVGNTSTRRAINSEVSQRLWAAVDEGRLEECKQILDVGPITNINFSGPEGDTALHRACYHGHIEIVEQLLENGADVRSKNRAGELPTHATCRGRSPHMLAVLDILLQKSVEIIDIKESLGGYTCLHIAAGNGDGDVVAKLLSSGANPDVADAFGETALDLASTDVHGHTFQSFLILVLKRHGKDMVLDDPESASAEDWCLDRIGPPDSRVYRAWDTSRETLRLCLHYLESKHPESIAPFVYRIDRELCRSPATTTHIKFREPLCLLDYADTYIRPDQVRAGIDVAPNYVSIVVPYFQIDCITSATNRSSSDVSKSHESSHTRPAEPERGAPTTLDEYCYPSLPKEALERRNQDQVISRSFNVLHRDMVKSSQDFVPIVMVRQHYMWKTQNVMLHAGTQVVLDPIHDQTGLKTNMASPDLQKHIADNFAGLIGCIEQEKWFGRSILDYFGASIVNVTEAVDSYIRLKGVENMGIEKEKDFIHQISDVREELAMIKRVLLQQEEIWEVYASVIWPELWAGTQQGRKPYYSNKDGNAGKVEKGMNMVALLDPNTLIQKALRRIAQLDEDAERVERSIVTQLDLKAKHASLNESHSTAVMSAAVFGFTVITVIFTPLSFATSLFALPIQSFQGKQLVSRWTDQSGMYTTAYIGKWTATIEIVAVSLTVVASIIALEFGLKFPVASRMFAWMRNLIYRLLGLFIFTTEESKDVGDLYAMRVEELGMKTKLSAEGKRQAAEEEEQRRQRRQRQLEAIGKAEVTKWLERASTNPLHKSRANEHRHRKWRSLFSRDQENERPAATQDV